MRRALLLAAVATDIIISSTNRTEMKEERSYMIRENGGHIAYKQGCFSQVQKAVFTACLLKM